MPPFEQSKSGRQGESMMKRLLLTTIGLVALAMGPAMAADMAVKGERIRKSLLLTKLGWVAWARGPAMAADMAVKAPPPAPIIPIYNWTGFYIGGNGGWAQNHNCVDFLDAAGVAVASGCRDR